MSLDAPGVRREPVCLEPGERVRVRAVPLEVTEEGRGPIGRGKDADFIQSATGCSWQVLNKRGIRFASRFQEIILL